MNEAPKKEKVKKQKKQPKVTLRAVEPRDLARELGIPVIDENDFEKKFSGYVNLNEAISIPFKRIKCHSRAIDLFPLEGPYAPIVANMCKTLSTLNVKSKTQVPELVGVITIPTGNYTRSIHAGITAGGVALSKEKLSGMPNIVQIRLLLNAIDILNTLVESGYQHRLISLEAFSFVMVNDKPTLQLGNFLGSCSIKEPVPHELRELDLPKGFPDSLKRLLGSDDEGVNLRSYWDIFMLLAAFKDMMRIFDSKNPILDNNLLLDAIREAHKEKESSVRAFHFFRDLVLEQCGLCFPYPIFSGDLIEDTIVLDSEGSSFVKLREKTRVSNNIRKILKAEHKVTNIDNLDVFFMNSPRLRERFINKMSCIYKLGDLGTAIPTLTSVEQDFAEAFYEQMYKSRANERGYGPIVTTGVHGTALSFAKAINANGFALKGIIDDGYYGDGMYFTRDMSYTKIYSSSAALTAKNIYGNNKEAFVIAMLNVGNILFMGKEAYSAAKIKPCGGHKVMKMPDGYDSSYTIVGSGRSITGERYDLCEVTKNAMKKYFNGDKESLYTDELCIKHEENILPMFLLVSKDDKL